jgi:hypothetical protein
MPIPLQCGCGAYIRVKDELSGRKVRCPKCATILSVQPPKSENDVEDEALNFLLADSPAEKRHLGPEPDAQAATEEEPRRGITPQRKSPPSPATKADKPAQKKAARREEDDGDYGGPSFAVNPEIITGLLMMGGAAVWFFVGLAAGYIFFYPPILFVLGIVAVARGFSGGASD